MSNHPTESIQRRRYSGTGSACHRVNKIGRRPQHLQQSNRLLRFNWCVNYENVESAISIRQLFSEVDYNFFCLKKFGRRSDSSLKLSFRIPDFKFSKCFKLLITICNLSSIKLRNNWILLSSPQKSKFEFEILVPIVTKICWPENYPFIFTITKYSNFLITIFNQLI